MKIKKNNIKLLALFFSVAIIFLALYLTIPSDNNPIIKNDNVIVDDFGYSDGEVIADELYDRLPKYENKAMYADGYLYVSTAVDGEDIKFVLSNLAIQNLGMEYGWTEIYHKNKIHENSLPKEIQTVVLDSRLYNKLYMYIPKVVLTIDGENHEAIVPANKFFIEGDFVNILPDSTTYLQLTFIKDENNVFQTTDGDYVYAPKIMIEVYQNATITTNNGFSEVSEGKLWTNLTVGMNIDGEVMSGYRIYDAPLELNNGTLQYVE